MQKKSDSHHSIAVSLCFHCSTFFPSGCKDTDDLCKSWASSGECKNNPQSMLFKCPRSCGVCPGIHDAQEVK